MLNIDNQPSLVSGTAKNVGREKLRSVELNVRGVFLRGMLLKLSALLYKLAIKKSSSNAALMKPLKT